MSQKFPVNKFEWIEDTSEFNEDFIKIYNGECLKGDFFEVYVQYPPKLYDLHNDLSFLSEKMKSVKVEKLVVNFHDKIEYVLDIRNLNQALNHWKFLKKLRRNIN